MQSKNRVLTIREEEGVVLTAVERIISRMPPPDPSRPIRVPIKAVWEELGANDDGVSRIMVGKIARRVDLTTRKARNGRSMEILFAPGTDLSKIPINPRVTQGTVWGGLIPDDVWEQTCETLARKKAILTAGYGKTDILLDKVDIEVEND
jgi:hypothetical protein